MRWTMSCQQQFGFSASGTTVILCSEAGGTKAMTFLCRAAILTLSTITGPEN